MDNNLTVSGKCRKLPNWMKTANLSVPSKSRKTRTTFEKCTGSSSRRTRGLQTIYILTEQELSDYASFILNNNNGESNNEESSLIQSATTSALTLSSTHFSKKSPVIKQQNIIESKADYTLTAEFGNKDLSILQADTRVLSRECKHVNIHSEDENRIKPCNTCTNFSSSDTFSNSKNNKDSLIEEISKSHEIANSDKQLHQKLLDEIFSDTQTVRRKSPRKISVFK